METFGEYEAVEELASTSVSTVYRARKAGGPARFAIKLRHIRQQISSSDTEHTPHPGAQPRERHARRHILLPMLQASVLGLAVRATGVVAACFVASNGPDDFSLIWVSRAAARGSAP